MTLQECVASADDKRAKQMKQEVVKSLLFPDEVGARKQKGSCVYKAAIRQGYNL